MSPAETQAHHVMQCTETIPNTSETKSAKQATDYLTSDTLNTGAAFLYTCLLAPDTIR